MGHVRPGSNKLGRVLEDNLVGAGEAVSRVDAEVGSEALLGVAVRVDVGEDVCVAHCVGERMRARIAQWRILLGDDRCEMSRWPRSRLVGLVLDSMSGLGVVDGVVDDYSR